MHHTTIPVEDQGVTDRYVFSERKIYTGILEFRLIQNPLTKGHVWIV